MVFNKNIENKLKYLESHYLDLVIKMTKTKEDKKLISNKLLSLMKVIEDLKQRTFYEEECAIFDKNGNVLHVGQKIKCQRGNSEIIGKICYGKETVSSTSDPYESCEIIGLYIKYENGAMSDSICEYASSEIEIIEDFDFN